MKLPDFHEADALNRLRRLMGAPLIHFESEPMPWLPISFPRLEFVVQGPEAFRVIDPGPDGTFVVEGKRVLVYIRDQFIFVPDEPPNYKIHLTMCQTLNEMRQKKRYESRYVVTNRDDGLFKVNLIPQGTAKRQGALKQEDQIIEMKVCRNCLYKLNYRDYDNNRKQVYESFNFKEFLREYETMFPKLPPHTENSMPFNEYSPNQRKLSGLIRKNQNYRCQDCGNDFSTMRHLLDVHHIDGAKNNNARINLEVLCVRCHAKIPQHGRLASTPRYIECLKFLNAR